MSDLPEQLKEVTVPKLASFYEIIVKEHFKEDIVEMMEYKSPKETTQMTTESDMDTTDYIESQKARQIEIFN